MFLYAVKSAASCPPEEADRITLLKSAGITHLDEKFHLSAYNSILYGDPVIVMNPCFHEEHKVKLQIKPDDQTWYDMGKYYIGYWNSRPPIPAAFLRRKKPSSRTVQLSDNDWELTPIPIGLPNRFAMDDEGNPYRKVASEFTHYLALCEKYWNHRVKAEEITNRLREATETQNLELAEQLSDESDKLELEPEEAFVDACRVIQLNYVLSTTEIMLMEWLGEADIWRIVYGYIHGLPDEATPKKKVTGKQQETSGSEDSFPTTSQPSLISTL